MNVNIEKYLSILKRNPSTNASDFLKLVEKIDFKIDCDYLEFIQTYNGCSGSFENGNCLLLWKIEDVIALNPYYDFIEECKHLFFIGSDGGSQGYAFNKNKEKIVSIDYLDIGVEEPIEIANTFEMFLKVMVGS